MYGCRTRLKVRGMITEDGNKFDLQIRSILGDATEEVPESVWLGIEKRLSSGEAAGDARRKRVFPIWLRIAGPAAAAAAVAAALFITGISDSHVSEREFDTMADSGDRFGIIRTDRTVSGLSDIMLADIPEAAPLMDGTRYPASVAEAAAGTGSGAEDTEAPVTAAPAEPAGQGSETSTTGQTAVPAADMLKDDVFTDESREWERLLQEEDKASGQRIRTSFTLSGNAISNSNASFQSDASAPISYRPGRHEQTNKISETSESSYSVPISFGAGVKFDFTERWALGIGVNYSMLRRTFAGQYYQVQENGELSSGDYYSNILNRQDYIGIPLNVYFSILKGKFIDFYVYAGGSAEKCVSNSFRMSADGIDIHHKEAVKGFQFSAAAGMGMEFIVADTFGIYIDPSLRYYFPDSRQPRSIRTSQPLMFGLELGFRIRL